jgi:DnaJ-class molecular chaperone
VGHKTEEEQAESQKIFVKIAAAYETLSDEKKR